MLLVPTFEKNLMSISKICNNGAKIIFENDEAIVYKNTQLIMRAKIDDGNLYKVIQLEEEQSYLNMISKMNIQTLHERLGHLSTQ